MSRPKLNPLNNLSEQQKKAVQHPAGPILIAAGAGSGKTHTLTSRLVHLLQSGIRPENIIAITFTNKAAKEMRNRTANAQLPATNYQSLFIGTFHSLGVQILKNEAGLVGRSPNFTIFDEDDSQSLLKSILKELNLAKEKFNPMRVSNRISQIKNEVLDDEELKPENSYEKIILSVYAKYEDSLQKYNAFDFDDLIEKVVRIFRNHPEVLEKYQNRWQQILVDEYQDVNTSQYLLIRMLAQKHQNLFVIGDDAQSIYSFRGSDFRNFLNFDTDWPSAAVIKLEENYRSTKNIIASASALIQNNKLQKPKSLWTQNQEGSLIRVSAYQSPEDEAWGIAGKIQELLKSGENIKDIAILYRTNAQSRALEQAMIQNQIPYEIFGGLKFYARKEIKDLIAGLRYAINPKDSLSAERIVKNFTKAQSAALLEELPRLAGELSIIELLNYILTNTNYFEYLETHFKNPDERRENIKELIHFATGFKNAQDFLEQIALVSSLDGRPKLEENAVKFMSIHLAKGLEFNNIFIAGANEGLLPHERSLARNDELEEERRLMYVAMTRAKKNLFIGFYDLPSRFLGELPPELIEFQKTTSYGTENRDWDDETIYLE